jgi:hypothetical protein
MPESLFVLRPVPGGWCVVGTWSSPDQGTKAVAVAGKAQAGKVLLALLRFDTDPDPKSGIATRFVALASEGQRLWYALAGKGGGQLIAREAKFRRQGKAVFLDVPVPSGATAVLRFDGQRFVKLN